MERIATITPIATRNTPFTISLMMPQRMPNTPKAVRIIKPHIANPMCCAICLKFAVAVISSLFLIFLFLMRIQELRELSFKLSYLPLVYPTFFLCVFLSHRSFSFRVLEKVGIRECKVFRSKYYPQGWRFLPKTGGLTLLSRPIPELPLRQTKTEADCVEKNFRGKSVKKRITKRKKTSPEA